MGLLRHFNLPNRLRFPLFSPFILASTTAHVPQTQFRIFQISLPIDVIVHIAKFLSPDDILNLSLTSSTVNSVLVNELFFCVHLKSSQRCMTTLRHLSQRPDLTRRIRQLTVCPNRTIWVTSSVEPVLDETEVVKLIEGLAGDLRNLHTFIWDGLNIPTDTLWTTLRKNCPIRRIEIGLGRVYLENDSSLFDFKNLLSFSLISKANAFRRLPLCTNLLKMLLRHCPDLEELSIFTAFPNPTGFNNEVLVSGFWPNLRSLTLSDFDDSLPLSSSIPAFLSTHMNLERLIYLRSPRYASSPMNSIPHALPNLRHYSGTWQDAHYIPNPALLQSLQLTCHNHHPRGISSTFTTVCKFVALQRLDIWLSIIDDPPADVQEIFKRVLSTCPQLSHLEVSCSSTPSFNIAEFSASLHHAPKLKIFVLTKVKGDEDKNMTQSAIYIARQNPGLYHFTLRYADPWDHLANIKFTQIGVYNISCSLTGVPVALSIHEYTHKKKTMSTHRLV